MTLAAVLYGTGGISCRLEIVWILTWNFVENHGICLYYDWDTGTASISHLHTMIVYYKYTVIYRVENTKRKILYGYPL